MAARSEADVEVERLVRAAVVVAGDLLDDPPCSIGDLFEACYRRNFTGSLTLHFQNGRPVYVDLGKPIRVMLDRARVTT
jgi:hypothetical protein